MKHPLKLVAALLLAPLAALLAADRETPIAELDLGARVQPVPTNCKFSQPGYFVWCGAPVRGADGKYHLFYSRWPVKKGFHPGWAIHSEIAYAVSDKPFGPYQFVNVALPARGLRRTRWPPRGPCETRRRPSSRSSRPRCNQ